jgi:hypothetical protein
MNLESLSLLNLFLRLVNTTLALEKDRSEGTDVAVITRYCFAIAASLSQSSFPICPQYFMGSSANGQGCCGWNFG